MIGYGITAEYEVENGPWRWCLAGLIGGVSIPILLNGLFILGIIVWAMLGMKGEGLFFIAIMLQGTWVIFPLVGAVVGVISGIVLKYLK